VSTLQAGAATGQAGDRDPLIAVQDLVVRYGEAPAVSGLSFTLDAGRAIAVLGINGAGKTTLGRAIAGLVPAQSGRVLYRGREITRWPSHRIRRAGLVYLPEGHGVFRSLTVGENLRMAVSILAGQPARAAAIDQAVELFPVLGQRRRQQAASLSGGEQQMLSLATALITAPQLIVADEMSLGLAPKLVDLIFERLAEARARGVTVVMIEQYVHRALDFADDCLIVQRGKVAWSGAAVDAKDEVLRHYLGESAEVS
jgi:branched-chain amino acid transport system ATP-binding protein